MSTEPELRRRQVAHQTSAQTTINNEGHAVKKGSNNTATDQEDIGKSEERNQVQKQRQTRYWSASIVFLGLLIFRVYNALSIRTFFQPDEFYQSLEPAWQLAFGEDSGAWLTWEWHRQLRSSLHPILFAAVYRAAAIVAEWLPLSIYSRDDILLLAPKLLQACIAASLDFYTWRLATRVAEPGSATAKWTLIGMVTSPWQWYCSTRTFSNSLEAALTAIALYFWPWNWLTLRTNVKQKLGHGISSIRQDLARLRLAYLLAALSVVLRPTGVILWLMIGLMTFLKVSNTHRLALISGAVGSGVIALGISALSDRIYYGAWTLPAVRFLRVNAVEKIADFYGVSRLDYYFTEGLPLLLCITPLPFTIWGMGRGVMSLLRPQHRSSPAESTAIYSTFAITSLAIVLAFTAVSHKEARFLYPLLPMLMILAAREIQRMARQYNATLPFKLGLVLTAALHIILAVYVTQVHQRGVIDIINNLRSAHQEHTTMTVGFLMPCHSTPWRSHLIHPNIKAWALTCEPPLGIPISERATYRDEADQFYDDPLGWVKANMQDTAPETPTASSRYWPDKLILFSRLIPTIEEILQTEEQEYHFCGYRGLDNRNGFLFDRNLGFDTWLHFRTWLGLTRSGFNTHWHDDWRRRGDIVTYCRGKLPLPPDPIFICGNGLDYGDGAPSIEDQIQEIKDNYY